MDVNDFEGRKTRRVFIGAHLVIGEDDDLIQWAATYQNGDRQAAIKATLRIGLQFDNAVKVHAGKRGRKRRPVDEPEMPALAQLPNEIMARLEQLEHENQILREYRDYNEQRWLSWEQGGPELPPTPIESIPDLDPQVKADRTRKVLGRGW